jgi:hypothetical protein
MAYNLEGIRTRVINDKLDDPEYSASVVDNFINDAQKGIFNQLHLPFLEAQTEDTLSEGDHTHAFPDDYQLSNAIILVSSTGAITNITSNYLTWREYIRLYPYAQGNQEATPSMWTNYGNTLYLSAPANDNYTLIFWYLKRADDLASDGDIPQLPSEFEELLVLGAYYRVLERNEDFDLASFYKDGDYTQELNKLATRYGSRQEGKPPVMSQPLRSDRMRRSGRA